MGAVVGGGKGAAAPAAVAPVVAPPAPSYVEDTSAMEAEKARAQKALLLMKGRQATILTQENQLGQSTTGKRQALGA